jgi:hypothetical protein
VPKEQKVGIVREENICKEEASAFGENRLK